MKRQIMGFLFWVFLISVSVAGPIVGSGLGCVLGPVGGQSANFYKGDYSPSSFFFAVGLGYKAGDEVLYSSPGCEAIDPQKGMRYKLRGTQHFSKGGYRLIRIKYTPTPPLWSLHIICADKIDSYGTDVTPGVWVDVAIDRNSRKLLCENATPRP